MIALLGIVVGLIGPVLPELLGWLKSKQEFGFKLSMAELQMRAAAAGHEFKMQEVEAQADISEVTALHDEFAKRKETWKWIEALISSVRPVLTYAFFALYATVKVNALLLAMGSLDGSLALAISVVWREEDQAIFAAIISFWFGNRAMQKYRQGK